MRIRYAHYSKRHLTRASNGQPVELHPNLTRILQERLNHHKEFKQLLELKIHKPRVVQSDIQKTLKIGSIFNANQHSGSLLLKTSYSENI